MMAKNYGRRAMYRQWNQDGNAKKIDAVLKAYHIEFSIGQPGDGYDRLVQIQPMELWEYKDPDQPPSARKLTDAELSKQDYCKTHHIPYVVIEYSDQAQARIEHYNLKRV